MLASALQSVRNFDRRSRYLLTLVALLAMTTGAWAQTTVSLPLDTDASTNWGEYLILNGIKIQANGDDASWGINALNSNAFFMCYESEYVTYTISMEDGSPITGISMTISSNLAMWQSLDGWTANGDIRTWSGNATSVSFRVNHNDTDGDYATLKFSAISVTYAPAAPDVTISTDQQSAEFDMPSYDATLEYQIVRNMASNMTVSIGDGQDGYRIRVKKDGESFVPAEMTLQQMMALYTVHDATEQKDLLFYGDGKVCDISIFAVDDQGQPTGQPIAFTALTPGRYVAIATAPDDSPLYAGQTPQSNIFVLYQGYEVTVPAGEYITYYRDEPLMVDKTQQPYAELYTISEVGTETATLSGPYDAMKTLTPMLVFNSSDDAQTILLIPTTEPDLAVTVAPEFKGTLEATQIAASSATSNNYAFNGKQFVWVKNALAVGQYKAWLEVPTGANARVINLVFDNTTGISNTNLPNLTNGDWYDLNGRKLQGIPTKKGVYIMNGKKVVVK